MYARFVRKSKACFNREYDELSTRNHADGRGRADKPTTTRKETIESLT
jgi:hypothetical protein